MRNKKGQFIKGNITWCKGKKVFVGENNPFYGKKHSEETKKKIREKRKLQKPTFFGHKHSEKSKIKISISRKNKYVGKNNKKWKGEKAGYHAKHGWVNRWLGRPEKCMACEKDGLIKQKIHWANISGEYKREITDWLRLCAKCHALFDRNFIERERILLKCLINKNHEF